MASYKNILVAVDVYEPYQAYLTAAQKFAARQKAKLHCVYVMPPLTSSVPYAYEFQTVVENEALKTLTKIKQTLNCETILLKGSSSLEICHYAETVHADLIICGSHGKHGIGLLGSTANGILHNASCDVLTIRLDKNGEPMVSSDYGQIVLASDLNPSSKKVAIMAKNLAQDYSAQLHIVHAITYVSATAAAYYPEIESDLKKEAAQKIQQLANELNINISDTELHFTTAKQATLLSANSFDAELIVVGSEGKSALSSALLGSTANALLHSAKCNVLVVRI